VANTQTVFGFRHIGYTSGGAPDYQLATGSILSSNTTKIFRGDPVKRGQVIANSGQTGNVDTPQLHFEVRKGPAPLDPMPLLAGG